jgi:hypothetical protein
MTSVLPVLALTSAVLAVATSAGAQDIIEDTKSQTAVEVTPYVSLGSSASSGMGVAVRWPIGANFSIELDTGQRRAELNGLSSSVSLLYDLPKVGRVIPYVAGGIGLEQYGFATGFAEHGPVAQAATAFTVNAGGGLRVPVDHNWGVRTDARWSNGVGRTAPERWRVYNGVTFGGGGR